MKDDPTQNNLLSDSDYFKIGLTIGASGIAILPGAALTATVIGAPIGIPLMWLGGWWANRRIMKIARF
jgi:hypothetical protein